MPPQRCSARRPRRPPQRCSAPRSRYPAGAAGRDVLVGVRPHQVTITRDRPGALELPAEIRVAEVTGSATFLHLLLQDGRHLVAQLPGTRRFTPGETTVAYVDPAHVFVFGEDGDRLPSTGDRLPSTGAAEVDPHG
ncbi:TOBE domain-containing protein [Nonomuraea antimicrobica]